LAEVAVHGTLAGHIVLGTIDRLIVTHNKITVIDFKTNLAVPANEDMCPEGILRQMGAYSEILAQIYPGRDIETGILWTATGQYMSLTQNIVREACERAHYLDVTVDAT